MLFTPDIIVVADRGYNAIGRSANADAGVYFDTRMKNNALFEMVEEHAVPQNRNIVKDQIIRLTAQVPKTSVRLCCAGPHDPRDLGEA